jgi:hypothetical protein
VAAVRVAVRVAAVRVARVVPRRSNSGTSIAETPEIHRWDHKED